MKKHIDFILLWADKGGVENVINETTCYLEGRNWSIRIVQLAWQGTRWCSENIPFFALSTGEYGHDTTELAEKLASFWSTYGIPDAIVSAGAPIQLYIVKHALALLKSDNTSIIPIISWLHGDPADYERRGLGGAKELSLTETHFAINNTIKNYILKNNPDASVYRVYNPIRATSSLSPKTMPRESNDLHLLFIGRLSPDKHVETILTALATPLCKRWYLDIFGSSDESCESNIRKIISELELTERVCLHGWVNDPWSETAYADALVLASEYEASPLVVPEALSHGIPVISTPVGDVPEILSPGKNGFLFPIGDSESLSKILSFWSQGFLPVIDPDYCKESVKEYIHDNALSIFESYITEVLNKPLEQKNRISIIIPCFNVEQYIDRCLNSICSQTLPDDLLEIILVDDGSTDETSDKLEAWKRKYDTMITILKQDNRGQGSARNAGLVHSTGKYLAFIDADDWIEKDYLEKMLKVAVAEDCDIVQCGYVRDSSLELSYDSEAAPASSQGSTTVLDTVDSRKDAIVCKLISSNAPFKLIKKSLIEDNKISFYDGLRYEDISFGLMLNLYARKVHILPQKLYHYYVNPSSTVLKMDEPYHADLLKTWKILWKELLSKGFMDDYKSELELEYVYSCVLIFWKIMVLRFHEPPYAYYEDLCSMTKEFVPDIMNNKYVSSASFSELHRLILTGTINHLSREEFLRLANSIRKIGL